VQHALRAMYSHCFDTDITAAEVMAAGGIAVGALQPRLTAAANGDLALLDHALATVPYNYVLTNIGYRGTAPPRSGPTIFMPSFGRRSRLRHSQR
jgi:hypothetical protein